MLTVLLTPLPYAQAETRVMLWSRWISFDKTWLSDQEILDYRRLASSDDLVEVMTAEAYGRKQRSLVDLRWMLGLAAFVALLASFMVGMRWRPRAASARSRRS